MAKTEFHHPDVERDDDGPPRFKNRKVGAAKLEILMNIEVIQYSGMIKITTSDWRRTVSPSVAMELIDALQEAVDHIEMYPPEEREL